MRRLGLAVALALALGGCAGQHADRTSAPRSSASPAPPPPSSTWVSPYDAQVMLDRDAPLSDLREDLIRNLQLLDTVRVEEHDSPSPRVRWAVLDIDYTGNCSGTIHVADGSVSRVIKHGKLTVATTDDGAVGDALDGRWIRPDHQNGLAEFCDRGAAHLIDGRTADNRQTWLLDGGRKIGMEQVRGKPALHVRQYEDDVLFDVWVAAFENPQNPADHNLYPVKITSRGDGWTRTKYFSRFNTAVVDGLPPRSEILDAGASQA